MKQTKSATPYLLLLLGMILFVPYANHRATTSQQIAVEVKAEIMYVPPAQAAVLTNPQKTSNYPSKIKNRKSPIPPTAQNPQSKIANP